MLHASYLGPFCQRQRDFVLFSPKMNSSDEEDVLILLLLRRRRKRKRHLMWCRDHFLLRESRGEFHRTFRHLLENPDEELFFNYTRMSYRTYNALKSLVLERLKPDHSNWRKSIAAEEKLIVTLRLVHVLVLSPVLSSIPDFYLSNLRKNSVQTLNSVFDLGIIIIIRNYFAISFDKNTSSIFISVIG